jgi:hypothetical protein
MSSAVGLTLPLVALLLASAPSDRYGLPLTGEEAEHFLKTARVVKMKHIGIGITRPRKVTLDDGVRQLHAVWKTVDDKRAKVRKSRKGGFQLEDRDSYKYEVAAYELDKLLGLHLVPPTVGRRIGHQDGSLQLWVEGAFTELDRKKRNLLPKDGGQWGAQMYKVELLNQLIYNTDAQNARNILYDPDFQVYAIDHSRAFRLYQELPAEEALLRFPRSVLERLRNLDLATAQEKLDPYLNDGEIKALMKRRDLIVSLADALVAKWGEEVVLY